MVGKNTRSSRHTESWKSSSFGPRNIGTGRKYTPSKDNIKVEESTVSQDQNRVTTPKQTGTPNKRTVNWDDPWAVELEIQNAFLTDDYSSFKELPDARIKQLIRDPQEAARIINGKNGIVNPEKQAAQDMIDNSRSNPLDLSFNEKVYRPWAEEYGERARPNSKLVFSERENLPAKQSLTPYVGFNWRENTNNLPFYNKNAVNRHIPDATHVPEFYLNPVEPLAVPHGYGPIVIRKAAEKAYDQKLDRKIAIENAMKDGLWGLGILGATAGTFYGLDKLGKYIRQDASDEQPQTQVPYRMEPEVQTDPTLEQQYAAQDIPSFSTRINNLFDLYQRQEQLIKDRAAYEAYLRAQEMGQRIATGTGYAPELKEDNFEFPQNPPEVGSNIKTAGLKSPNGGKVPQELNRLSGVKPKVIKDTSNGPVVLNDPNHRKSRNEQSNSITPEQAAVKEMVNQYAGIPAEVVKAKNQPFLTTDAIWNRLRQKGLVSPEEGIRSGLFTPDEVRYITENDLWRYR